VGNEKIYSLSSRWGEGPEGAHNTNYRGLAVRKGLGAQNIFVLLGNIIIFFIVQNIPYRRRPNHSANDRI